MKQMLRFRNKKPKYEPFSSRAPRDAKQKLNLTQTKLVPSAIGMVCYSKQDL